MARVMMRNIGTRLGVTWLFEGFDLEVANGELLCLLGPSDSGKAPLPRMIAGLEGFHDGERPTVRLFAAGGSARP